MASRREERMQAGLSEALLLLILQLSASPKDPLVLSKPQGLQLNSYLLFLWVPHSR